jgi:hypothetical protein
VRPSIALLDDSGEPMAYVIPHQETVRCECRSCGAHVMAPRGRRLAGWCSNCDSYDLKPVETPVARVDPRPVVSVPWVQVRVA